jgi:2-oxoisovalerate dehydrogenase E1 component
MRANDPVIFFEHRALLDANWSRRPYPGGDYLLSFGQARIVQEGDDLTVITWGAMVERCENAAADVGGAIEIIDLRTIVPWDQECVLASVRRSGKCLIVHEDIGLAGFGAEIAATIAEAAFEQLDGPVARVAAPAVPVPFNTSLMDAVVPTTELIAQRMRQLLEY